MIHSVIRWLIIKLKLDTIADCQAFNALAADHIFKLQVIMDDVQVGSSEIVARIVEDLKDESEPYRRMVMETVDKVIQDLGTADISARLEELLIDGILYAFQEQVSCPLLSLPSLFH